MLTNHPSVKHLSCADEVNHVGVWASSNNMRLNHAKSAEIVFVPPRGRLAVVVPEPAAPNIPRVENIKILGVTLSRKFSVAQHVDLLLVSCAQSMFALRTLRHHGLPTDALRTLFSMPLSSRSCRTRLLHGGDSPQAIGNSRIPVDRSPNFEIHLFRGRQ